MLIAFDSAGTLFIEMSHLFSVFVLPLYVQLKSYTFESGQYDSKLTHILPMLHFCKPLKTSENLRFSDVFMGYRNVTSGEHGLISPDRRIETYEIKCVGMGDIDHADIVWIKPQRFKSERCNFQKPRHLPGSIR